MDITAAQEVRWPGSGNVKMGKSVVFLVAAHSTDMSLEWDL